MINRLWLPIVLGILLMSNIMYNQKWRLNPSLRCIPGGLERTRVQNITMNSAETLMTPQGHRIVSVPTFQSSACT